MKTVKENEGENTRGEKKAGFFFSGKTVCLPSKRHKQAGIVRFSLFIIIPCLASLEPCRNTHVAHSKGWVRSLSGTRWKWQILLHLQKSSCGQHKFESVLTLAYIIKQILHCDKCMTNTSPWCGVETFGEHAGHTWEWPDELHILSVSEVQIWRI